MAENGQQGERTSWIRDVEGDWGAGKRPSWLEETEWWLYSPQGEKGKMMMMLNATTGNTSIKDCCVIASSSLVDTTVSPTA